MLHDLGRHVLGAKCRAHKRHPSPDVQRLIGIQRLFSAGAEAWGVDTGSSCVIKEHKNSRYVLRRFDTRPRLYSIPF